MSEPQGLRDLNRLRWVTIVLPIVFVWGFELIRFIVLDPNLTSDESHVAAAMVLGGAIVLFGSSCHSAAGPTTEAAPAAGQFLPFFQVGHQ